MGILAFDCHTDYKSSVSCLGAHRHTEPLSDERCVVPRKRQAVHDGRSAMRGKRQAAGVWGRDDRAVNGMALSKWRFVTGEGD